ncbi:MAG: cupin domain-containing protein [Pseudomonadota bacterium]
MTDTLPTHVKADAPTAKEWHDPARGDVRFFTVIDADYGPTEAVVQGVAHIEPGDEEKPHHHEIAETVFVLDGAGQAVVGDKTLTLAKGDTVFVPAGVTHGWKAAGDAPLRFLFTFPADRFEEVAYHFREAA